MMPSSLILGLQLNLSSFCGGTRGLAPASIALAINHPTLLEGETPSIRKWVYAASAWMKDTKQGASTADGCRAFHSISVLGKKALFAIISQFWWKFAGTFECCLTLF